MEQTVKKFLYNQVSDICSRWFIARDFLYPEDGGDMFWKVG
jgi:hypothetical protein